MIKTPIPPPQEGREAHSAPHAPSYTFLTVSLFKPPPPSRGTLQLEPMVLPVSSPRENLSQAVFCLGHPVTPRFLGHSTLDLTSSNLLLLSSTLAHLLPPMLAPLSGLPCPLGCRVCYWQAFPCPQLPQHSLCCPVLMNWRNSSLHSSSGGCPVFPVPCCFSTTVPHLRSNPPVP